MSRDLTNDNYYVTSGGKIPVKWTAPEVSVAIDLKICNNYSVYVTLHNYHLYMVIIHICTYILLILSFMHVITGFALPQILKV